ncbi:sensor domain-containing diguanylate cyclase [Flavisphingomonas formosensis]|uniref:sensor domain-containing diguanylate cyclase n=1 Tax=Flavisphingomonas formosensis TaxID=861534 RepID=UPI0012F728E1|nr:sensor domain-containing diguanylate cyclase [Sphingomonas formosensis]
MADVKLNDEEGRVAALHRYHILDTREEEAFENITQLVQSILRVPISAVSLVDRDRQWFKSRQGIDARETSRDVAFCNYTIRQREPMIVSNANEDARFQNNPLVTGMPHIASYAGVPLETPDGYQIGSLCAIDTVPREFDAQQIDILRKLGKLVVEQMELRQIAERDHLTGALTRRAFLTEMDKEITRFQRYERPATLLMLDVDHFKAINDGYGHPAGDRVLTTVSKYFLGTVRTTDCFGRLGGEEFGVLLPDTDGEAAIAAANRFREELALLEIGDDPIIRVTASFGIAPLSTDVGICEQWLAEADIALYRAKRSGRNRCCLAEMKSAKRSQLA